ncbi:MAG: spore photoproduct lyase [Ignavibacteriales bacterium]
MEFVPQRVFFEEAALSYPLGRELLDRFRREGVEVARVLPGGRIPTPAGLSQDAAYRRAKRSLVVAVRRTLSFQTCRPSAHYQLPLVSSCPGLCEYCYLQTTLGPRPYIRVYVNLDEILDTASRYIGGRLPATTVFEGAATSDPMAVEGYTGAVARAISFFAGQPHARFRVVTKFSDVDGILGIEHRGHTRLRFSVNIPGVIEEYEHGTPGLEKRLRAAAKVAAAGYPVGFLIAPVIAMPGWEGEYRRLVAGLAEAVPAAARRGLTFEIISHRFTPRARSLILRRHPGSSLPMDTVGRRVRMGQFGYIKYVYPDEVIQEMKRLFQDEISRWFPEASIEYII